MECKNIVCLNIRSHVILCMKHYFPYVYNSQKQKQHICETWVGCSLFNYFFFLLRGSVCDAKPGPSLKRRTKLMLHSLNTTTLENVSALFVFNIIKLTLT